MKYVIDRTTWLRGEGSLKSYLFRKKDSKSCCWGFVCLQSGLTIEEIQYHRGLYGLFTTSKEKLKIFFEPRSEIWERKEKDWISSCYSINDNQDINDSERESLLIETFAQHDHELTFIN